MKKLSIYKIFGFSEITPTLRTPRTRERGRFESADAWFKTRIPLLSLNKLCLAFLKGFFFFCHGRPDYMDLMQGSRNESRCLSILGIRVAGAWCRIGFHHLMCEKQSAAGVKPIAVYRQVKAAPMITCRTQENKSRTYSVGK